MDEQRDTTAERRDPTIDPRDVAAGQRNPAAGQRDVTAERRDPVPERGGPATGPVDPTAERRGPAAERIDPAAERIDPAAQRGGVATERSEARERPVQATAAQSASTPATEPEPGPGTAESLWDTRRAEALRGRWHEVQTGFVDDPRSSVAEARALVDEAVRGLSDSVRDREDALERTGARAADSTEGMRDTVQQYHQLLDRLLSV